ncbi:MAG: hypothetical protein Q9182_005062 [Xanthomendoza sp. 2 TL-2023]
MSVEETDDKTERDPEVVPGGMIQPPSISPVQLIDASIRPRMSFYLDGERTASFVIDATASHIRGQPWNSRSSVSDQTDLGAHINQAAEENSRESMTVKVIHKDSGANIISRGSIRFNETGKEFPFSLAKPFLQANQTPQTITLELTKKDGRTFTTSTTMYYLPNPRSPQSVTRIDSIYGGLQVRTNGPEWKTVFPYSFYVSGAWLSSDPGNLRRFRDLGFNILHVVPGGEGMGYDFDQLDAWFQQAEQLGLYIMYDMRHSFQNPEHVRYQVERYKSRKNMLLWYTADEPGELPQEAYPFSNTVISIALWTTDKMRTDGHEVTPSATSRAYTHIKSLDPYHPISLCLNCQNYHFQAYSAGTDILMTDTYPIGVNTSFSNKYQTPCNLTHGDCGCDNCHTSPAQYPALSNIPARLRLWSRFQSQLDNGQTGNAAKPIWAVPQAFPQQDFWTRTPTPSEIVAMVLLSVNHGATGVIMWLFPTAEAIEGAASRFGLEVLWKGGLGKFVVGARGERVGVVGDEGGRVENGVDAVMWRLGRVGMLSVVFLGEEGVSGDVRLEFGEGVRIKGVGRMLWGRGGWRVDEGGRVFMRRGMEGVESWVFVVELEGVGTS